MTILDLGFPADAVPSRRRLINNNSSSEVQLSNIKIHPEVNPTDFDIQPQAYYTVYVSGNDPTANGGVGVTKETVYTLPIVFTVDLFVGPTADDVVPPHGTMGPRGVKTIANDIQYYHCHEFLGLDASSQAISGLPPIYGTEGSKKDSQSGLNTFYNITTVDPFILPVGMQLYMDLSATQADSEGLLDVSAAFLKDNSAYTSGIEALYHGGQQVNGALQYVELYNSALPATSISKKDKSDTLITTSFEYESPDLPIASNFVRVKLSGSSYDPSAGEVATSSGDFITLVQNLEHQKTQTVEGREYKSGKGNLTITQLQIYSSEYNAADKAVYDLYKMRSNGFYEPLSYRVPIYASSNVLPANTMMSVSGGTSSLDLVETYYDSRNFAAVKLAHATQPGNSDGEAIIAVCRENTLEGTGYQTLTVHYEGYYEQTSGYKITTQTGREYEYHNASGRWRPK